MRTHFPVFDQIAAALGNQSNLQVLGLTQSPQDRRSSLYLAAWQASSTGAWMIPSYNALAFSPQITTLLLAKGYKGNLQAIGLVNNRIYVAACQDNSNGSWNAYSDNPLDPDGSIWEAIKAGHKENILQIVGIGSDRRLYAGPWQLAETGDWNSLAYLLQYDNFQWQDFVLFNPSDQQQRKLSIIGIGLQDRELYFGASLSGDQWNKERIKIPTGKQWLEIHYGNGPHDDYFVGLDNKLHSIQKITTIGTTTRLDPDNGWWKTIKMANGYQGNLYIVGLGRDDKLYLGPWNDREGWHPRAQLLALQSWQNIILEPDGQGQLQVFGVSKNDGKLYIAAWQDDSGNWHPSQHHGENSKSLAQQDDSGRWNTITLKDVPKVFAATPNRFTQEITYELETWDTLEPVPFSAHFQGMALYKNYYILPHSAVDPNLHEILIPLGSSQLFVLDRDTHREVLRFDLPNQNHAHPGGCQIVGDYLALELEAYKDETGYKSPPIIRFYWLASMNNGNTPTLMPSAAMLPEQLDGGSAIAITSIRTPDLQYVIALKTGRGVTFFHITDYLLDDPDFQLGEPIEIQTEFLVNGEKNGPDNINLLADDSTGNLYLLSLGGNKVEIFDELNFKDFADLWKVDLKNKKITLVEHKHIITSAGLRLGVGVHFRFGAGSWSPNPNQMILYGCEPQGHLPGHGLSLRFEIDEFRGS